MPRTSTAFPTKSNQRKKTNVLRNDCSYGASQVEILIWLRMGLFHVLRGFFGLVKAFFHRSEYIWDEASVLSSGELDYFVSMCDASQYVMDFTVKRSPASRVPFGAFPSNNCTLPFTPPPSTLTWILIYGTRLKDDDAFSFQHYVNHVAYIMMPYEDSESLAIIVSSCDFVPHVQNISDL